MRGKFRQSAHDTGFCDGGELEGPKRRRYRVGKATVRTSAPTRDYLDIEIHVDPGKPALQTQTRKAREGPPLQALLEGIQEAQSSPFGMSSVHTGLHFTQGPNPCCDTRALLTSLGARQLWGRDLSSHLYSSVSASMTCATISSSGSIARRCKLLVLQEVPKAVVVLGPIPRQLRPL